MKQKYRYVKFLPGSLEKIGDTLFGETFVRTKIRENFKFLVNSFSQMRKLQYQFHVFIAFY